MEADGAVRRTIGLGGRLQKRGRREMAGLVVVRLRKPVGLGIDPIVQPDLGFKPHAAFRNHDSNLARRLKIDAVLERFIRDQQRRIDARSEATVDRVESLLDIQELVAAQQCLFPVSIDGSRRDPVAGPVLNIGSARHVEVDLAGAFDGQGDAPRRFTPADHVAVECDFWRRPSPGGLVRLQRRSGSEHRVEPGLLCDVTRLRCLRDLVERSCRHARRRRVPDGGCKRRYPKCQTHAAPNP